MPDRLLPYRALLAASVVYFVAGGVASLWFPGDGLDLYASYVAGTASLLGEDAYARAAYLHAWDSLATPASLASARAFPFAYPPAWMPIALALAVLPWGVALVAWKVVNVLALAGIVAITERMLALEARDRLVVRSFALVLSPTISVMALGQSSLVAALFVVASARALKLDRPVVAGVWLALAMVKPQLALPLAILLCVRGEIRTLAVAAVGVVGLSGIGLLLAHSSLDGYLTAVQRYAAENRPDSHIGVGVASLLGHFGDVEPGAATAVGLVVGTAVVALAAFSRRAEGRSTIADLLPVVLYAAPLGFHCHGYDMVALVPLFAWARTRVTPPALGRAIQAVCLPLVVPRSALRIAWTTLAGGLASDATFRLVERSFRSWIVLVLLPLVLAALRRPSGVSRERT